MNSRISYRKKPKNQIKRLAFASLVDLSTSIQENLQGYRQIQSPASSTSLTSSSSPISDFFSGITGIAPSKLEPPIELLRNTKLDPTKPNVKLSCVYKASKDGWSATDFHKNVDSKGSAIVIALSSRGKRFGGYNPIGWMSSDDYLNISSAWLWFESNDSNTKVPILQGGNAAIFDYFASGPSFGSCDLVFGAPKAADKGGFTGPDMIDSSVTAGDLRSCTSSLGITYEYVDGWTCPSTCQIVEMEVYCNELVPSLQDNNSEF